MKRRGAPIAVLLALAGCASVPPGEEPAKPQARGGYYKDDGPHENPPQNLDAVPDAEPKEEPLHRWANRPYRVFGVDYVPLTARGPFRQRGMASWYGRRFHGQKTSSGEPYDMYAMSAAHPTLPIPSYARVTHIASGRSVVVRINDRGPFHAGRIIDLSYAAAHKLGLVRAGSGEVEVQAIVPGQSVFLQLGAFQSRDTAESLRSRAAAALAELGDATQVLLTGNLWRLQVGPYRSQQEAREAAARIEALLELKPLVVVR